MHLIVTTCFFGLVIPCLNGLVYCWKEKNNFFILNSLQSFYFLQTLECEESLVVFAEAIFLNILQIIAREILILFFCVQKLFVKGSDILYFFFSTSVNIHRIGRNRSQNTLKNILKRFAFGNIHT